MEDQGGGQPFVLLHDGVGAPSVARFAQLLAGQGSGRVLTPTHPGFGGTPRPDGLDSVAGLAATYLVLLDAVGAEIKEHPVADVSGLSLPEIQSLSFHDPVPFRVDPAAIPDAQKKIMAGNAAALTVYAGTSAMTDPTLLGRLSGVDIPTLVLWGDNDQIADPDHGHALAASIHRARFQVLPGTGHMPQMETPDLVLNAILKSDDSSYRGSCTA